MKIYYMKVRNKFIDEIYNGTKKHEYRLNTDERRKIKIGDILVLISNQNPRTFVKVAVTSIEYYDSWDMALDSYWEEDFKNLFSKKEDVLRECYKFYSKNEVDTCGIAVFGIKRLNFEPKGGTVLLDTNIMIRRESSNNYSFEIASLFNWFDKLNINKFYHNRTKNELENYSDVKLRNAILAKLGAYNLLPSFDCSVDEHFQKTTSRYSLDSNGIVDNALLLEVYNYNVDFLLTNDQLMLRKAEELFIRDRVLTSDELMVIFENLYPKNIEYKMLSVKLKRFADINLDDHFFDTLREDYEGIKFDNWFKRKYNEQAYIFEDNVGIRGFLYLKIENEDENYSDINPIMPPMKRLKVGTFKIESTGFRLGERFLKIIFDNAIKNKVDEIYVTLFENKREDVIRLKTLMEKWGFVSHGYKKNGELVLRKTLTKYIKERSIKENYPLISSATNHFILPIYPEYHTDLFPDNILNNENMHLYQENKAHRYAIEKIYLSGAKNVKAHPGDLVLIYRNGTRYPRKYSSVVTGVAIIEELIYTTNVKQCINECKNRSIFSEEEIKQLHSKYPLVVKLLDFIPFKNKVILDKLYKINIVDEPSGPRPFMAITKEQFEYIYRLGMKED